MLLCEFIPQYLFYVNQSKCWKRPIFVLYCTSTYTNLLLWWYKHTCYINQKMQVGKCISSLFFTSFIKCIPNDFVVLISLLVSTHITTFFFTSNLCEFCAVDFVFLCIYNEDSIPYFISRLCQLCTETLWQYCILVNIAAIFCVNFLLVTERG